MKIRSPLFRKILGNGIAVCLILGLLGLGGFLSFDGILRFIMNKFTVQGTLISFIKIFLGILLLFYSLQLIFLLFPRKKRSNGPKGGAS